MANSANMNVMIKAARMAGRSLLKDFGEVENLQVGKLFTRHAPLGGFDCAGT